MKMKAEILEYSSKSGQGHNGPYEMRSLTLLDRSEGPRLKNTVDFMLTVEQAAKLPTHEPAKLQGTTVEVGITEISQGFGGRMRLRGDLLMVNGKAATA